MELPSTLVFEAPTIRQLAAFFVVSSPSVGGVASFDDGGDSSTTLEMVGFQNRLAGGAVGQKGTLAMVSKNLDVLTLVPKDRWDAEVIAANLASVGFGQGVQDRLMFGAFMYDVHLFDNSFFGIATAEAGAMDPQQRLLMELGYEALYIGGRRKADLLESDTGVLPVSYTHLTLPTICSV
eukprot:4599909-Prymnesium_polylepis.1